MSAYCDIAPGHPVHSSYHDTEYGFPVTDERALFERMALEIMQAGLSWEIVLKKRKGMNKAFHNFNVNKVAAYTTKDITRLLADENIIRNRLKVQAIITNAQTLQDIRKSHKSFAAWIETHHPLTKPEWVKLFKKNFKFMGDEIVGEFLMSIGYLQGSHHETCPVQKKIIQQNPAWKMQRPKTKR
jgi:DNA-3-methyladenine glycosylase I